MAPVDRRTWGAELEPSGAQRRRVPGRARARCALTATASQRDPPIHLHVVLGLAQPHRGNLLTRHALPPTPAPFTDTTAAAINGAPPCLDSGAAARLRFGALWVGGGRFCDPMPNVPPTRSTPSTRRTDTAGASNRVNKGGWKKAMQLCKAAERCGSSCLSADAPGGHPCNADCTRMTREQQLAAAIGARRGAPPGARLPGPRGRAERGARFELAASFQRQAAPLVPHRGRQAGAPPRRPRRTRPPCSAAGVRRPGTTAAPDEAWLTRTDIAAACASERCGGQCLSAANPAGCMCNKLCRCKRRATFAGVRLGARPALPWGGREGTPTRAGVGRGPRAVDCGSRLLDAAPARNGGCPCTAMPRLRANLTGSPASRHSHHHPPSAQDADSPPSSGA
jgi:hypothetical protein